MSKLYIPTSTLNFNNLFSSESISPAGFYSKRGFGYQTFGKVELNKFENSILLYSKFPQFTIPKSDFDDYPMIIEIEKEEFLEGLESIKEIDNIKIYQCDKTIYLNPYTTRIFFIDEIHRRIALSKSDASAETKLVRLYQNCLEVYKGQVESFIFRNNFKDINDLNNISITEIEKDKKINRIKGFAFSYLIGANKSLSKDIVCLKKQALLISNIVSSILNSTNSKGSIIQEKQLSDAINSFNKLQCIDIINELNLIGETKKGEYILDYILNKFKINLPIVFDANKIRYVLSDRDKCNYVIQQLFDYVEQLENNYISLQKLFSWEDSLAITTSKLTSIMDSTVKQESGSIYQSLINEVLTTDDFNGKSFSPKRLELATEITKKVKSCIEDEGKKWEDHIAKEYLNSLRKNVGGDNVAFEIKWDSGVLPAIAAFILKGDDPDKLEDFLIDNEISDYRLAFGFYGAIFGFATLSKAFTNKFYENPNKRYVHETYKAIFKQLHNIEIYNRVNLFEREEIKISKIEENKVSRIINNVSEYNVNLDEIEEIYLNLEKKCPSVKKQKDTYIQFITEYGVSEILISKLSEDKKLNVKDKTINFFKGIIKPQKKDKIKSDDSISPVMFEPYEIASPFYLDTDIWNYIKKNVPTKDQSYMQKQLEWIQKIHREGGYKTKDGKFTPCDDKSNDKVISFFYNLIKKQIKEKRSSISFEIIEKINAELIKRYSF